MLGPADLAGSQLADLQVLWGADLRVPTGYVDVRGVAETGESKKADHYRW